MGQGTLTATAEPKYWHLRTVLLRTMDAEFSTGQVLPNERDLSARFGVARATLRQALDQLELEGRLVRRRGIGTLIAAPRVGIPVTDREAAGRTGATRSQDWKVVDCTTGPASAALARTLGLAEGEQVHTVRRLRTVQGVTVAAESLHVPSAALPHLAVVVDGTDRARGVLRQLDRLGIDGESRSVELGVAEAAEAALLERPPGTPVLVVTTQYATAGRLAAVAVSTYRADTCKLTFGESGVVQVATAVPAAAVATAAS
ncbi:GntR family transcriptional regulator [Streptomyces sp. TLI_171]|uniref:GntR family transcriptional regulator n=1 Tax=Streptomyces sp. TLI_171 TaxID=1938859 RepID=UPI000C190027|nr:GntR family transcriptional regulator [Streptomyces sp. TLI_171]RKE23069.1 DNA-binding GntR family transcriptional regulator [Streptomyces sp. TLI_171]